MFVNNQPATVAVLRLLAPHLATIHAQNESILSFDGPARLGLLDAFAGSQLEPVGSGVCGVEADSLAHRGTGARRAGPAAAGGFVDFSET